MAMALQLAATNIERTSMARSLREMILQCFLLLINLIVGGLAFFCETSSRCRPKLQATVSDLNAELRFNDRFDRWRFLGRLLEDEIAPTYPNQVLYHTLDNYIQYPRPSFEGETGSPERTEDRLEKIQNVLQQTRNEQSVDLLLEDEAYNDKWFSQLELLLPDPVENEDEYKSLWDLVIELNGRESVKINERNNTPTWRGQCLMARILIYYDFLTYGMVDEPLNEIAP